MPFTFGLPKTALEWAILCVLAVAIRQAYRFFRVSRPHYPPGPPPDFLIGNLRHIPHDYQEKEFEKWGKKYGDVVYAHLLGKDVVILNSMQAARDLLEKRSAIYSDRPRFVLLTELMGWDSAVTHMPYGERFRKHRRFIHESFNLHAILDHRPLQSEETGILIDNLLKTPELFIKHIRRFAASPVMKIAYGHSVKSEDDAYVRLAEEAATATVEAGSPASTLVDFFPPMKFLPTWFPGAGFKRNALDVRKSVRTMMNVPFDMVKSDMRSGLANCLVSKLLESHRKEGDDLVSSEDEEDIKGAAGTLYAAAADTTLSVLSAFFLAMVMNPDVYEKAQAEIDRVVGYDRLPCIDDADSLPYFYAVLKEVYRWCCPVPLGIPHCVMTDDVYRDFDIPQNAMIIANIWAMSRAYPQPEEFRPERFMDSSIEVEDPRDAVFGFGRRVCPGRHFAEAGIWVATATITATLRLTKALDEHCKPITPNADFTSGFTRHPKPFVCSIRPRSKQAMELARELLPDEL